MSSAQPSTADRGVGVPPCSSGVEEAHCLMHAPNERVDPAEIAHMTPAGALFHASYRP